jgi:hypothetical protein
VLVGNVYNVKSNIFVRGSISTFKSKKTTLGPHSKFKFKFLNEVLKLSIVDLRKTFFAIKNKSSISVFGYLRFLT